MIRILVRQVSDPRQRCPKSIAVVDVRQVKPTALVHPVYGPGYHTIMLHSPPDEPSDGSAVFYFRPTANPLLDPWQYVREVAAAIVKACRPPHPR